MGGVAALASRATGFAPHYEGQCQDAPVLMQGGKSALAFMRQNAKKDSMNPLHGILLRAVFLLAILVFPVSAQVGPDGATATLACITN